MYVAHVFPGSSHSLMSNPTQNLDRFQSLFYPLQGNHFQSSDRLTGPKHRDKVRIYLCLIHDNELTIDCNTIRFSNIAERDVEMSVCIEAANVIVMIFHQSTKFTRVIETMFKSICDVHELFQPL